MKIYINGMSNISPQHTFGNESGWWENVEVYQNNRLACIHPDYKKYYKPLQLRRMSKILRMGLTTALDCLELSGGALPEAIIAGTGLGSIGETGKFLHQVLDRKEQMLNPSPFIYSTHNTVAAQIAIHLKCHGYNATYSNNGFSFENALHDGMLLLEEGAVNNVLIGAVDEMTEEISAIRSKTGLWKREQIDSGTLYDHGTPGTIAGEGAVFFWLERHPSDFTRAAIKALRMLPDPGKPEKVTEVINSFLSENGLGKNDLDLVITGDNGDVAGDEYYEVLRKQLPAGTPTLKYKHLCGEYYTSGAFGLWLAASILREPSILLRKGRDLRGNESLKNVLLYNHYGGKYHSFYLLTNDQI